MRLSKGGEELRPTRGNPEKKIRLGRLCELMLVYRDPWSRPRVSDASVGDGKTQPRLVSNILRYFSLHF